MSSGHFSNRWRSNYDIVDAMGPLAQDIAEMVPDKYIDNFTPIVNNLSCIESRKYRVAIMLYRCGIRTNINLITYNSDFITYLDALYNAIESKSKDPLIVPEQYDALASMLLPSNSVLKDPKCVYHTLQYYHKIDEYLKVIRSLPDYMVDIMKYLLIRGKDWNVADNYFYLIVAMVASNRYPIFKQTLRDIMSQIGIYTMRDPIEYISKELYTYPSNATKYLSINPPALWFEFPIRPTLKCSMWINTDLALIRKTGVILAYNNHIQHLEAYKSFTSGSKVWFMPTVEFLKLKNFTETTMSMEDVKDCIIIGYGSNESYCLYSTYEIEHAIRLEEPIEWQLPGLPNKPTEDSIQPLLTILEQIGMQNIIARIHRYCDLISDEGYYNREQPYLEFFKIIVEIGLFARRWESYKHPFPYSKKYANNNKVNPETMILPLIHKCNTIMQKWQETPQFNIYNNDDEVISNKFLDLVKVVFAGNECIRVSSYKFIATGLHYLNSIYGKKFHHPETGEALDLTKLEPISFIEP
jgi:hypothetical protein